MKSPDLLSSPDHLFRNEFAKAVSFLTNKYGTSHLETAEDAVQEALIKAMQLWPYDGVPSNPTGWIIRVAQNKLIDHLRRAQKVAYQDILPDENTEEMDYQEGLFKDDLVKMMFACCNPILSIEQQVILTLKILAGLSVKEISAALLKNEDTIAKAYTRAKRKFKEKEVALEIPDEREIDDRLNVVLKVIYLLFNEGYKSTSSKTLIRSELCLEALRLNRLLLEVPKTNTALSRSLISLMCFHAARLEARTDRHGVAISLEDQDRSLWKPALIQEGNYYLDSISDTEVNEYFVQAAIIGIHTNSPSFQNTDWQSILELYNVLYRMKPSAIVGLNRIIALHRAHGADAAWEELQAYTQTYNYSKSYLYFAILSELEVERKNFQSAIDHLTSAIDIVTNTSEKEFLKQKLQKLQTSLAHSS